MKISGLVVAAATLAPSLIGGAVAAPNPASDPAVALDASPQQQPRSEAPEIAARSETEEELWKRKGGGGGGGRGGGGSSGGSRGGGKRQTLMARARRVFFPNGHSFRIANTGITGSSGGSRGGSGGGSSGSSGYVLTPPPLATSLSRNIPSPSGKIAMHCAMKR